MHRALNPLIRITAALLVATSATACANLPIALPPRTAPAPGAVPHFALQPGNAPTISSGRAGLPIVATDPSVYVDDEGYHLFYSTFFCQRDGGHSYSWDPANPGACDINKTFTSIAYAFSADRGLTWRFRQTPVVLPTESGFAAYRIETSSFARRGNTAYLVFSSDGTRDGKVFTARYQIGLATLSLGSRGVRATLLDESQRFQLRPTPLLSYDLRPGRFDNNVQEPSITVGPQGIVLYYIGLGFKLPDQPLDAPGQGISNVGLGRAVLDDQFNVVSRSSNPIMGGVNITEVRYFDNAYHLFATTFGGEAHRGEAISYATSTDGMRWSSPVVVISPGSVPGFNDWGLMAPTAAVESNQIVLFFTAFGLAGSKCQPLGPSGRFGFPVLNETNCMYPTVGRAVAPRPIQ